MLFTVGCDAIWTVQCICSMSSRADQRLKFVIVSPGLNSPNVVARMVSLVDCSSRPSSVRTTTTPLGLLYS